jgi:hypothetical protein
MVLRELERGRDELIEIAASLGDLPSGLASERLRLENAPK